MSTKQRYYLAGFIFILAGVFFGIRGGIVFSHALASKNWPDTMGTIIQSEVKKSTRYERRSTNSVASQRTIVYTPEIHYNYSVDDYQYSSSRIIFGFTTYSFAFWKALDYVDEFPVGEQVPIYYDPAKPERSVLKPGVHFETCIFIIIGVILIWIASAFFLKGAKQED